MPAPGSAPVATLRHPGGRRPGYARPAGQPLTLCLHQPKQLAFLAPLSQQRHQGADVGQGSRAVRGRKWRPARAGSDPGLPGPSLAEQGHRTLGHRREAERDRCAWSPRGCVGVQRGSCAFSLLFRATNSSHSGAALGAAIAAQDFADCVDRPRRRPSGRSTPGRPGSARSLSTGDPTPPARRPYFG